jgi:hypothetical protein
MVDLRPAPDLLISMPARSLDRERARCTTCVALRTMGSKVYIQLSDMTTD